MSTTHAMATTKPQESFEPLSMRGAILDVSRNSYDWIWPLVLSARYVFIRYLMKYMTM